MILNWFLFSWRVNLAAKLILKKYTKSLTFVEDINTTAISGSVLIKDNVDLLNTFPISGHETITLEFRTPGIGSDFIKILFSVVEVTDKVRAANERGEVYRVRFVSTTLPKDKSTKISKSFKGKISDMAKKIYGEYIGGSLSTQPTKNEHKFVIPRWSPFKALEYKHSERFQKKRVTKRTICFLKQWTVIGL